MLRRLLPAACLCLCAAAALAAEDIPTRYQGSFPGDGTRTAIAGTFSGKTLRLRFLSSSGRRRAGPAGRQLCPWLSHKL